MDGLVHPTVGYLRAPGSESLQVGSYEGALAFEDPPYGAAHLPGMAWRVDGRACTPSRGRFDIRQLERDDAGHVVAIAVDFQHACGSDINHWLRGQLRVNSSLPVGDAAPIAAAGPDMQVKSGRSFTLDGSASGSWLNLRMTPAWRQVSGPHVDIADPDALVLAATAPVLGSGTARAEFELGVGDVAGGHSVDRASVIFVGEQGVWSELDITRINAESGKLVQRAQHDVNNAFQEFVQTSESEYHVRSIGPDRIDMGFGVDRANDSIPTGVIRIGGGLPRFTFSGFGDNVSCVGADGALRVVEASGPSTQPTSLAADFDILCGSQQFWGFVRIRSAAPVETNRVFANAGPDLVMNESEQALLSGLGSLIVNNGIASYAWTQVSGPAVNLLPNGRGGAKFRAPDVAADTDLVFELKVTGHEPASGTDEVVVRVRNTDTVPPPSGGGGGGGGGGPVDPLSIAAIAFLLFGQIRRQARGSGIMPAACRTDSSAIPRS
jgi:hypothetical protein